MKSYNYMQSQEQAHQWSMSDKFFVFLGAATLLYFVGMDIFTLVHREFFAINCYANDYI